MRFFRLLSVPALATFCTASAFAASTYEYKGTIGSQDVGFTVGIAPDGVHYAGHYFFAGPTVKDIALTVTISHGMLQATGGDGSVFTLHMQGNGSTGKAPLTLENSVALAGAWAPRSGQKQRVMLGLESATSQPMGHRYADVTTETDAAFEGMVQGWLHAVQAGDHAGAAQFTHFPLRVNRKGKTTYVRSAAQLSAEWGTIFTPAYIASLRGDLPHEMSVHNGMAMLGRGDAWFDAKGVASLNLP